MNYSGTRRMSHGHEDSINNGDAKNRVDLNEFIHLANNPFHILFACAKARNASAEDRRAAGKTHFRHPGDLSIVELAQKFRRIQVVPCETNEG